MNSVKKAAPEVQVQERQQSRPHFVRNLLEYTGNREMIRNAMQEVRKARMKG